MYLLTLKSGKIVTRVQCGCANEQTFDLITYAADCGTFYSFTKIEADKLPDREEEELYRVEAFIKLAREYAVRFSRELRYA